MTRGSFFLQTPEEARRHVTLLEKGLKKVGWTGMVGGAGCGMIAMLLGRFMTLSGPQSSGIPGARELSGVSLVAWFLTIGLLFFSILYLVASWGLSHQKSWARYMAASVFLLKVLVCVWLGRGSIGAMCIFLFVAAWDFYGLWVLLAKETGHLFSSPALPPAFESPTTKVRA
jgi:uncharacterized membrane protein